MSIVITAKTKCARVGCGHPKSIHNAITTACEAIILTNPWNDADKNLNWDETDCPCPAFVAPEGTQ